LIKYCPSCKKDAETYDTFRCSYCIACWREYSARYRQTHKQTVNENTRRSWHKHKEKYNLDRKLGGPSLYEAMFTVQRGVCAICGRPETSRRYKTLSVDHCHTTGQIRGLLCSACNRALGLFQDNQYSLQNAINYLKGSQ